MNDLATKPLVKTSFGRLLAGMVFGGFGLYIATIIPLILLLMFKFLEIDPANVTTDFSFTSGLGGIITILASYFGGLISDRTPWAFGRRRTWILIGSIAGAIALVGVGMAKTVGMVTVLWCIALAFYYTALTALSALVPDQVDERRRGTASGVFGFFNPLSIVVGMGLMTALNSYSVQDKFNLLAAISVICALISCALIKEGAVTRYNTKVADKQLTFSEWLWKIYPNPFKYPAFSWGVLTRFLVCVAFASQVYGSLYLMQHFHIPQDQVAGLSMLTSLVQTVALALSSIIGGMLSDKFRKQKPFVSLAAIFVAIGVFMMAFAPSLTYVFIGTGILGFGYGMYIAVDIAMIARILPSKKDAAKDFGIMSVAGQVPSSLVPAVAPALIGAGGFPLFYGVLAVAGILSAAAVAPIPEMSSESME